MDFADVISARRAVRAYTSARVEESTVRALLRAAVLAPSAMNAQPWVFAIVQDVAQLARWSDRAKREMLERTAADPKIQHYEPILREPSFNIFYDASTLVVIGVRERGTFSDADCWLAAENLMLAASNAGLGTCCIGFALGVLNAPETKAELGLPERGAAIAPIIVGHPRATPSRVPRSEPVILSWSR